MIGGYIMTLDGIVELIRKLVDVLIVWLVFYYILKSLRKNVKMVLLFKGILIIIALKILSDLFSLPTIGYLLDYIIQWGPLAIIIIFQPEIRNVLEQLGRSQLLGRHKSLTVDEREKVVYEIVNALEYLRKYKIRALIVIERENSLGDYIQRSKKLYAELSSDLLIAIFYEGKPLHDGGVIIQGDQITSAGAVFPTSSSPKANKRLGTRHRAALCIAEETDCIALLLSEETGRVSLAIGGELYYNMTIDEIKMRLLEILNLNSSIITQKEGGEENDEK